MIRVRNGVDLPARVNGRSTVNGGPLQAGAVGRLTGQKGFDLLTAAVAELVRRGHRLEVQVAGEGRDRARLESAAEGLPIRFLGVILDVPALLSGLDLFCLPSRREALPRPGDDRHAARGVARAALA
ncbi:glycosyltransferase [Sphaerisporangium aureirubrum]|uniref:Glycosyltransferase n=1 Tax=Sphaerisporangium aureirubrum TaxID=1544736 RepID=A0ABW1NMR0_9ACTN